MPESSTIAWGDLQQIYYGTVLPPNAPVGSMFIHTVNQTIQILTLSGWVFVGGSGTGSIKFDTNGTLVGTRPEVNFIPGSNISITGVDNAGANRVDVTIASTGSGTSNLTIDTNGNLVGTRPTLNFDTTDLTVNLSAVDNSADNRVDIVTNSRHPLLDSISNHDTEQNIPVVGSLIVGKTVYDIDAAYRIYKDVPQDYLGDNSPPFFLLQVGSDEGSPDYGYLNEYDAPYDELNFTFNLSQLGYGCTLIWEYSKGSGVWGSLTVTDGTDGFTQNGSVTFTPPVDWEQDCVAGPGCGYLVRVHSSTTPTQGSTILSITTNVSEVRWSAIAVGSDDYVLTVVDGFPTWQPSSGGGGAPTTANYLLTTANALLPDSSVVSAYPFVNADIASDADLSVSKLSHGTANQVLTTDGSTTFWGQVAWDIVTGLPSTFPSDWNTEINKPSYFPIRVETANIIVGTESEINFADDVQGVDSGGVVTLTVRPNWTHIQNIPSTFPSTPHNLLDASVDQDTLVASAVNGALIVGTSNKWGKLPVGTSNQIPKSDGIYTSWSNVQWGEVYGKPSTFTSTPHTLLDGYVDSDTTSGTVTRGDLITGQGVSATWTRLGVGTANQVVTTDGTDVKWGNVPLSSTVVEYVKNDTNVTANILNNTLDFGWQGTLAAGRLNSSVVESVSNDTNVTANIINQNLGLGFQGTLAASRLNSSVVESVSNDTNITANIVSQNLGLGFTGTLSASRLNANVVQGITNDTNIQGTILAQTLTFAWASTLSIARGGTGLSTTSQNYVFAGPTSSSGAPTWRLLVAGDMPSSVPTSVVNDTNVTANIINNVLDLGWSGTLAISRGGTGQSTKQAAFDALSPLGSAGDILYYNGSHNANLAIGTAGQILEVVSGEPYWQSTSNIITPVTWANLSGTPTLTHNLLDANYDQDTLATTAQQGMLIVGTSNNKWVGYGIPTGATSNILRVAANGQDPIWDRDVSLIRAMMLMGG